jgi:kynurenine 3-monooxygenase
MNGTGPSSSAPQKTVVVGVGPVGALAALYAAIRGDDVEVYELRSGMYLSF